MMGQVLSKILKEYLVARADSLGFEISEKVGSHSFSSKKKELVLDKLSNAPNGN